MYTSVNSCDGLAGGLGIPNDFVLDIGDVHHVIQRVAARAQPAAQDVREHEGPEIADMGVVVDGRPAGVHPHDVVVEGIELLQLLGQGVIEPQGHVGCPISYQRCFGHSAE